MRHVFRSLAIAMMGTLLFVGVLPFPLTTFAQDEEVELIPTGISPISERTPLLSFPLSVQPPNRAGAPSMPSFQDLLELTVTLEDRTQGRTGLSVAEDFLPLTASALTSGLALYREGGSQRGFNYAVNDPGSDIPVDLASAPTVTADPVVPGKFSVLFRLRPNDPLSRLAFLEDKFPDFYIVGQTSLNLMHGDRFEVSIPANGIKIRDRSKPLPKDTFYENRFPGEVFGSLNPEFAIPAVFEGDIVRISTQIRETENSNRIGANSEAITVLGLDTVGRNDQQYFLNEVRVNWVGVNLQTVARLAANLTDPDYFASGASGGGFGQGNRMPSYFYSPWFYNFPIDAETGELLLETRTIALGDEEIEIQYPMTMPLDDFGLPREAFQVGVDDLNSHVTGYTPFGPRNAFSGGNEGFTPRVVSQDVLRAFRSDAPGGIFMYRDLGGLKGKFDSGVDRFIKLDEDAYRTELYSITPEDVEDPNSPVSLVLRQLFPGLSAGQFAKEVVPMLFQDSNLAALLLNVGELPAPAEEPRPPLGSLECYMDPDCLFFDVMINIERPYLGLTEGQMRYLAEHTEGNGRTNAEDLFAFNIVQGFTFVLPIARNNAFADLQVPVNRSGTNAGPDFFIAIQTSSDLRNLDSFVPFILPQDVKVGTQVQAFTRGETVNVSPSVSSIGVGRPGTGITYAMIGRPEPNFLYQDLTQAQDGANAGSNNVLYDRTLNSPAKAVIGLNIQDYGQNPNLVNNFSGFATTVFEQFFTESTVLGVMDVEFLPGPNALLFNPAMLAALPLQLNIVLGEQFYPTGHSVALYQDDDTPQGDGRDNDGDGLFDEEDYNLQDDDGDLLIDEDIGDGNPAGTNGSFDVYDTYYPQARDRYGVTDGFSDATYIFQPNDQEKYQAFLQYIQAQNPNLVLGAQGDYLPMSANGVGFMAELDFRVLSMVNYSRSRFDIFPSGGRSFRTTLGPPWDPPTYNQGRFTQLEPRTGLIDLLPMMIQSFGDPFPFYPDDLFVEDPASGDLVWLINFTSDDDLIPVIGDPDGDPRRTFALSLAGSLRFPNPVWGFVRVGRTPMVVNVVATDTAQPQNAQNPQGDNIPLNPWTQMGFYVQLMDTYEALVDYISDFAEQYADTLEAAYETKADFEEAVQEAIDAAAEQDPPGEPEYPELPEPAEFQYASPLNSFGIADFLDTNSGVYDTNYMYQLQLPDENFGPLAGNDFFVVLRSAAEAVVGDTFKVRINGGRLNNVQTVVDPDSETGTGTTAVRFPDGGIGYSSFIDPNYTDTFRNVSKASITTGDIVVRSRNVAPTITFLSPGPGLNRTSSDFTFDISFIAQDPDDVARVELYVDDDNLDYNGVFIPGANLSTLDTQFTVNLLEAVPDFDPTKSYYIYAKIYDGVNAPFYTYASGALVTPAGGGDGTGGGGSGGGGGGGGGTVIVQGVLRDSLDYVKIADDGRNFTFGEIPGIVNANNTGTVVDMETNPNFSGQIILNTEGHVLLSGDAGAFRPHVQPNGTLVFSASETFFFKNSTGGGQLIPAPTEEQITLDRVRDVEVDFANRAIYILDGDGDMLFLGRANTAFRPEGLGLELYRDMELTPMGNGMYFLSGNGILSFVGGGSSAGTWSNIIPGDVYRDMALVTQSGAVTHVVIVDENGAITVVGPSDAVAQGLSTLVPTTPIPAGSVRSVKVFPNLRKSLLIMEGSGKVHVLSSEGVVAPADSIVFAEEPGIDNDHVVDIEVTSVNLQSVVEMVRNVLRGLAEENQELVLANVSPNYKDRSGNNTAGLRKALNTMFGFFEIDSYAESRANQNSFVVSNQGDKVVARVLVDLDARVPIVDQRAPEVETGSAGATTFVGEMIGVTSDQTIRLRERGDGRGWTINVFLIDHWGRLRQDVIDSEDVEFDDYVYLTTRLTNRRLTTIGPRNKGVEDSSYFAEIDVDETNPSAYTSLLIGYFENNIIFDSEPPVLEILQYLEGSFVAAVGFDEMLFNFNRKADGTYELTSMNLRTVMQPYGGTIDVGDPGTEPGEPPELEVTYANPYGFSFIDRGVIPTVLQSEADFIVDGGTFLTVGNALGAIMMLPENTDIYALNVETFLSQLTRSVVKLNPYDPANVAGGTGLDAPGRQATLTQGRSYFVIARDGKHFGFVTIVPAPGQPDEQDEDSVYLIDYRFEDSFILPNNF